MTQDEALVARDAYNALAVRVWTLAEQQNPMLKAQAQTIDEILSRGSINIGVLVDLPPYGLLNDKQQPDGYDIDVAKLMGSYLGVKVNLVPLTSDELRARVATCERDGDLACAQDALTALLDRSL